MIEDVLKDSKSKMEKSISALQNDLSKLRTGRAHPSILDHIRVSYYGNETPLSQVANVAVEDARTLSITPWEKALVPEIEKAIMSSDLGLNPRTAGAVIHVPLPALTEERRRDLARLVRDEAEQTRVAIRNIRRDANSDFKELLKEKEITEDDDRRAQSEIQKLTDNFVAQIDKVSSDKEKDLMQV